MTDPQPSHRLGEAGLRRPGIAHITCTVRPAFCSTLQVRVFHGFERERPPLLERFARRHNPDVIIELSLN